MKIRNINPQGDVQVAALGFKVVKRGEVIDVPEDVAALLVIQTANWDLPEKAPKGDVEFVATTVSRHLKELAEASAPPQPEQPVVAPVETPGEGEQA